MRENHRSMTGSVNMRDVARRAGVSPGTVSRVLSNRMGRTQVSESTRRKILDAVRELDYVPNINASRLFSNKTGVLALVLPYFENPRRYIFEDQHLVRILNGLERTVSVEGYRILLIFSDRNYLENKEYLKIFRSKQVDGIFVWGSYCRDDFYRELSENGFPHVFITTRPDYSLDDTIYFQHDYTGSSYMAMRHLLEKGHRRIAWCTNGEDVTSLQRELNLGVCRALEESGLKWDDVIVPLQSNYHYSNGCQTAEKIHKNHLPVTALLMVSHDSAIGCYDYFIQHGIKVPGDYALACCDSLLHEESLIPITRVACDDVRLGQLAAKRLLAILSGEQISIPNRLSTVFTPGRTT